jgi:Transposase, Mutator family
LHGIEPESLNLSSIRKGQKRFGGFVNAMYAQGMTVREIKRFLEEQYKVELSSDLISSVTDSVLQRELFDNAGEFISAGSSLRD